MNTAKSQIEYSDFSKVDVRVGTILSCEAVENSDKLLLLKVDFGSLGKRQILSGIAKWYECSELINVQTLFVVNLLPKKMMGYDSEGMLFALGLDDTDRPVLVIPREHVKDGEGAR